MCRLGLARLVHIVIMLQFSLAYIFELYLKAVSFIHRLSGMPALHEPIIGICFSIFVFFKTR